MLTPILLFLGTIMFLILYRCFAEVAFTKIINVRHKSHSFILFVINLSVTYTCVFFAGDDLRVSRHLMFCTM